MRKMSIPLLVWMMLGEISKAKATEDQSIFLTLEEKKAVQLAWEIARKHQETSSLEGADPLARGVYFSGLLKAKGQEWIIWINSIAYEVSFFPFKLSNTLAIDNATETTITLTRFSEEKSSKQEIVLMVNQSYIFEDHRLLEGDFRKQRSILLPRKRNEQDANR